MGTRDNGAITPHPQAERESARAGLSPELMGWARRQFDEEEFKAGLEEIRATGGLELKDFIHELEQEAERRE